MKEIIVDYIPFEITPQQINESMKNNNGRLVVKGVLQRAEAKNQNGRVYPKETLMREAEKYSSVQIKERRALGELDHPDSSVVNLNNSFKMFPAGVPKTSTVPIKSLSFQCISNTL